MCVDNGWIIGNEKIPSFTGKSIINQPSISAEEVTNLRRVFLLYAKLPKNYWDKVEKCENNPDDINLFQKLLDLRWSFRYFNRISRTK